MNQQEGEMEKSRSDWASYHHNCGRPHELSVVGVFSSVHLFPSGLFDSQAFCTLC